MLKNSYNKFFPVPRFLAEPSFGLDISDESLKFVELIGTKNGIRVGKYGKRKIPSGIIEAGKIKKPKLFEEILSNLKKEEGLISARVSLSEEQIYLFKLRLEKLGLKSIREGIELSLEEHVPIQAQDAIFDYELLNEDDQHLEVQVAVIPKNMVGEYLLVFRNSGILISSLEFEAQALARVVVKKDDLETYMVVDFGEKHTGISIISRGIVMLTSTLDVGGVMLTNMIQKNFKISFEEAEKMKRRYGLQRNTVNKEMFSVLLNGVSILRDEIAKHFLYWNTHKDDWGKDNPPIKKIILCGGDSGLIGISEYFSVTLKNPIEIANVWTNIVDVEKYVPEISFDESLSFAVAIGLALGDFKYD